MLMCEIVSGRRTDGSEKMGYELSGQVIRMFGIVLYGMASGSSGARGEINSGDLKPQQPFVGIVAFVLHHVQWKDCASCSMIMEVVERKRSALVNENMVILRSPQHGLK